MDRQWPLAIDLKGKLGYELYIVPMFDAPPLAPLTEWRPTRSSGRFGTAASASSAPAALRQRDTATRAQGAVAGTAAAATTPAAEPLLPQAHRADDDDDGWQTTKPRYQKKRGGR